MGVWLFAVSRRLSYWHEWRNLQSCSLFICIGNHKKIPSTPSLSLLLHLFGSMIWGILPPPRIFKGHFMGLIEGVILAIIYRKKGPQRPKYLYEIEKELGIEPPDLEGMYWKKVRQEEEKRAVQEEERKIVYHLKKEDKEKPNK